MRNFTEVTEKEIIDVLLDAIDTGDWHTPSVGKLEIKEQSNACIYGTFESSLHNTYRNEERTFNINANTVKIWEDELLVGSEGVKTKIRYKPINNLIRIAKFLEPFQEKKGMFTCTECGWTGDDAELYLPKIDHSGVCPKCQKEETLKEN